MGMQEFVRLGFCFYDPEGIEEGIKRLGKSVDSYYSQ
jgi:DNA-binding transcriptional MocR family regulator